MQNVQHGQGINVEAFKKTKLDTLTITNGDKGYDVLFSFIDAPRQPKARGQVPTFDVSVSLNKQEQAEFLQILEPYSAYIEQVFAQTSRRKASYFKPEKDKISKQPTGVEMLTIKNSFPVKVFDINNNEILPAPRIPKGSKVGLQFGVVPFELNGENGVSMTRLYAIKVFSWGEGSSGGFGASTGEAMSVPDYAKPRTDVQHGQPQGGGNPAMMNYAHAQGGGNPAMMNYGQPMVNPNQNYNPAMQQYNPNVNHNPAMGNANVNPSYNPMTHNPMANANVNPSYNPMTHNPANTGMNPNATVGTMNLGTAPNINANGVVHNPAMNVGQNHPFVNPSHSQDGF